MLQIEDILCNLRCSNYLCGNYLWVSEWIIPIAVYSERSFKTFTTLVFKFYSARLDQCKTGDFKYEGGWNWSFEMKNNPSSWWQSIVLWMSWIPTSALRLANTTKGFVFFQEKARIISEVMPWPLFCFLYNLLVSDCLIIQWFELLTISLH